MTYPLQEIGVARARESLLIERTGRLIASGPGVCKDLGQKLLDRVGTDCVLRTLQSARTIIRTAPFLGAQASAFFKRQHQVLNIGNRVRLRRLWRCSGSRLRRRPGDDGQGCGGCESLCQTSRVHRRRQVRRYRPRRRQRRPSAARRRQAANTDKVISEISDSGGSDAQPVWKADSDHWRGGLPAAESEITADAWNEAEYPRGQSENLANFRLAAKFTRGIVASAA